MAIQYLRKSEQAQMCLNHKHDTIGPAKNEIWISQQTAMWFVVANLIQLVFVL